MIVLKMLISQWLFSENVNEQFIGATAPPPPANRHKSHSLKKAKYVE